MDISVVIPAYNEESYIKTTIASIMQWMPSRYDFEVIVVDHGSQDRTAALAVELGAIVVNGKGLKTIAALRNFGVDNSNGDILFFIDADITFTQQWSENIEKVITNLEQEPNQICGSLPKIPLDSSMLMKYWFDPKSTEEKPKYIGSCHLLTSKSLFERVGGFPAEMETAEEFTFCINATQSGAKLTACPELVVVHHGAPNTLFAFAKREVWHGRGDWTNLTSILSSKVALLTIAFLLTHLVLMFSITIANNNVTSFSVLASIGFICLFSSFMKFSKQGMNHVLINSFTFYIYFFARSLSLFSALFSQKYKKRSRSN
jgi:glycosyltransferase involved in cell wall biosynthesis